jgi:hypothetical protein
MFLSYDNPQGKGNDSWDQNRTKVDPRYRLAAGSKTNVTAIKGFSATGETVYNPGMEPFDVNEAIDTITRQLNAGNRATT